MRRSLLILLALLGIGGAVFLVSHRLAAAYCERHLARSADDLDWLRIEFGLSPAELENVRRLHEGYLPVCERHCARIAQKQTELQTILATGTNNPVSVAAKLSEIGAVRAQCQSAMLQHFQEVSQLMPPDQGRRYLAEMQRLTLGFHEQFERSMIPGASPSHGHH